MSEQAVSKCCGTTYHLLYDDELYPFYYCDKCGNHCEVEPVAQPEPQGDRITLKQSCGHRFRCADCGFCVQASNDEVGANRQLDKIVAPLKAKIAEQETEIKRLEGMLVNVIERAEVGMAVRNEFEGTRYMATFEPVLAKLKAQSEYKEEAEK
jgi:hypothetical protein